MSVFRPGVQISKEHPWDSNAEFTAHMDDWNVAPGRAPGSMRMIFFPPTDTPARAAFLIQTMQNAGKYVIACINPPGGTWSNISPTQYADYFSNYIAAGCNPEVWSLGNEPGTANGATTTGPYWARAKAAADRIHALSNSEVLLGAPRHDQRQAFFSNARTWGNTIGTPIPQWADAFDIHVYANNPAQSLNAVETVRDQVDGFTPSWSAMPMYITEFGWGVFAAASEPHNLVVGATLTTTTSGDSAWVGAPGTATDTGTIGGTRLNHTYSGDVTQAGYLHAMFNGWIANRTALKLRAATWYVASDLPFMGTTNTDKFAGSQGGYCGLQKTRELAYLQYEPKVPVNQIPPTGTGEYAFRPAYHRLTSGAFDDLYDGVVTPTPPDAITDPATNVAQTTAGLLGHVNPNGKSTTRYFRYGTSPTLATYTQTSGSAIGAGTSYVNVGFIVSGLTANTTYYFRVVAQNADGQDLGAIRSFSTATPPLPPLVTTGAATNIVADAAVLNGIVDPRGTDVTDYHFEYDFSAFLYPSGSVYPSSSLYPGTTTGAFTTPSGTLLASGGLASVSASIGPGLVPNTKYFYRLIATNATGTTTGSQLYFFTTPTVGGTSSTLSIRHSRKPSLAMSVEIQTADGRTYRWDQQAKDMKRRAYELTFSTAAGDGFADASCLVYRPANLDYPDLQLLTKGRFIAADGSIAYEGRVAGIPRSIDDSGEVIRVQFQGLMAASGKDRPFMEVYCDRSGERWQNATLRYRLAMASEPTAAVLDADFTATADAGSLSFQGVTQKVIPTSSQGVLEWQAPSGCKAKIFQYKGTERNIVVTGNPYEQPVLYSADAGTTSGTEGANMGSWDSQAITCDGNLRMATLTTARDFLGLRLRLSAPGDFTPAKTEAAHRNYRQICVYGDHGVPLQGPAPNPAAPSSTLEPQGVFASDVMADIIDRFCPLLDSSEIVPTSALIEHLVFDSPTYPFDAMTLLNGFHQWLLGAFEEGKVIFRPPDLTKADWLVRRSSEGVSLDLDGDSIDAGVANGMPVIYTDVEERQLVLWPDQYEQLRDDDPNNPANKEGTTRWPFVLELSRPATKKMALRLGEVALLETNRAKQRGTINVAGGYMMDGDENPRPSSEVRYGDTVAIADLPNDFPRLITATTWQEDGSISITLEQPPSRVDAVIARLEQAVFNP